MLNLGKIHQVQNMKINLNENLVAILNTGISLERNSYLC